MADFTGSNLYLAWVYSGGTVVLSGDYRTFSEAPTVDLVDVTAGADTYKTRLVTLKDGTYQYAGLLQTAATGGTALKAALARGTYGSLIVGPEGTAVGKPKTTIPAISMAPQINYPYADAVEISNAFQQNGAEVEAVF